MPRPTFLVALALALAVLLVPADLAAQGKGKGGGGGGGGGGEPPPPADPAIVYIESGVRVMNADGSNQTTVVSNLSFAGNPRWSPDLDGDPGNGFQGAVALMAYVGGQIRVVLFDLRMANGEPTAENLRTLLPDPGFATYRPAWSPDLKPETPGYQGFLAFELLDPEDNLGIYLLPIEWDGNEETPSTVHDTSQLQLLVPLSIEHWVTDMHWSPDGRLAFTEGMTGGLYVIDDIQNPVPRLVVSREEVDDVTMYYVDWSRESGGWVLLGTRSSSDSEGPIWLVDVDDAQSTLTRLTVGPRGVGAHPSWAPDDTGLVFHAIGGRNAGQMRRRVYRHEFATGTLTELAEGRSPDWRKF